MGAIKPEDATRLNNGLVSRLLIENFAENLAFFPVTGHGFGYDHLSSTITFGFKRIVGNPSSDSRTATLSHSPSQSVPIVL